MWYIFHGFHWGTKKGVSRTKGKWDKGGGTEQLFSLVLIKMWAALKKVRDSRKKKGHVTSDCVHKALKVLQINTKFTFKRRIEMGERISCVSDKQHISMLCSLPLFFPAGR